MIKKVIIIAIMAIGSFCYAAETKADNNTLKLETSVPKVEPKDNDTLQWEAIQRLSLMIDQLTFILHKITEDPGTGPTFKPIIESAITEWRTEIERKIKEAQ